MDLFGITEVDEFLLIDPLDENKQTDEIKRIDDKRIDDKRLDDKRIDDNEQVDYNKRQERLQRSSIPQWAIDEYNNKTEEPQGLLACCIPCWAYLEYMIMRMPFVLC